MVRRLVLSTAALLALFAPTIRAEAPALETEEQKTLYTLGVMVAQRMGVPFLTEDEVAIVQAGLADGLLGRNTRVQTAEYASKITEFLATRLNDSMLAQKAEGKAYLEGAAQQAGAIKRDSGGVYRELEPGSGAGPGESDTVVVHYQGTLYDGKIFDSSRPSGRPATFKIGDMIDCFGEGVRRMKVGGTSRMVCPPETAYGDQGAPPQILPGATLVFEVELIGVVNEAAAEQPGG
jgi:FKBP-type peptidyl-prolyl cis-trans isomerase FkpA/FKBP-type peptidyl-prolyl cis-trans isomerase FklB